MSGRLITPPDVIVGDNSILISDPTDIELTTLILWLKTVPENYDLHLYHMDMNDDKWLSKVLQSVQVVLLSQLRTNLSKDIFKDKIIVDYGPDTEYQDPLQYFLKKHIAER